MAETPIILIHGTWGSEASWDYMKEDLENLGLNVITPSLRHHDLPYDEAFEKVGAVSITDYVHDIIEMVKQCETPPLLLGHSLGCLIAQLVAEKVAVRGLILLGPAPTADIFRLYPTMIQAFARHFLRWGFWRKPMPPYKHAQYNLAMQNQSEALKDAVFAMCVPESGLVYTQMAFPQFDCKQTTTVDFNQIKGPVLIITGSEDKMTVPQIAKATAKNYGQQATLIKITGADHYYIAGAYKDQVIYQVKRWLQKEALL